MTDTEIRSHYTAEDIRKTADLEGFIKNYIDPPRINGYCRTCPKYCKVWSCPEHDFDPVQYWKVFSTLELWCRKITLDSFLTDKTWTPEELTRLIEVIFFGERKEMGKTLRSLETERSISLSAGHCDICGADNCARREGKPCRFPKERRYSIESLGGDVTKITEELFGLPLEWPGNGKLPKYFLLVGGILAM